jgi:hypothetical protein
MDLVAKDTSFPLGRPTPSSVGIVVIPSHQETAIADQIPPLDQSHPEQGGHQGNEDQEYERVSGFLDEIWSVVQTWGILPACANACVA